MGDLFGISAGANALGQGSTAAAGYYFQNKDATRSARHAREFAERVMRNQIQWQVKDLQKAGLNPILAVHKGGPGTMNPGQKQVVDAFQGPDMGEAVNTGKAVSNQAEEKRQLLKTGEIVDAAADKARSDAVRSDHEAFIAGNEASASIGLMDRQRALYEATLAKYAADTGLTSAQAVLSGKTGRVMDLQYPGQVYDARVENSWLGKASKWSKPVTGAVGDVSGAVGGFLAGRAMRSRAAVQQRQSSAQEGANEGPRSLSPRAQQALDEMRSMGQ